MRPKRSLCRALSNLIPEGKKQKYSGLKASSGGDRGTHLKTDSKETVITNPPTHMEIAIMLNVSRETVTRVFQSLQNRQIVRRDGPAKLIVNKLDTLQKFAEGAEEL